MELFSNVIKLALPWVPFISGLLISLIILLIARHFLITKFGSTHHESGWIRQLLMVLITSMCLVGVILALPIGDTARGQLLSLLGILATGAIALSSTTFIGNAMAGLMLRAVEHIRLGDFIRVKNHVGRVTEQGLLHTEIQTEDRDLTTLPNLYLVDNAVTVVRESGTVVSATISLGYDLSYKQIEPLLIQAAEQAQLNEPFVQILELGDYSITYRVAGLLKEVKFLISVRSRLRKEILSTLHQNNVEIVSPSFMNQRQIHPDQKFIPVQHGPAHSRVPIDKKDPESVIFDKADEAEIKGKLKGRVERIEETIDRIKKILKEDPGEEKKKKYDDRLTLLENEKKKLLGIISD